ncbi:hypothetical protein Tco_0226741 [Tanacetum coccineum]
MYTNHKSLQYILDQRELNVRPRRLFNDYDCKIQYHLVKANVAADALSRKERAKPLRVGALVMTINSNLPPQIHEAQVAALKKENVKNEKLHGTDTDFETCLDRTLCIRSRNWHRHLYPQVLDVFKDEGRLSEAIRFTGTTIHTSLEMQKYSHGFYHKRAKDNKILLHDLGNHDHQKNYAGVRHKLLEFQVGGISVEKSDTARTITTRFELPDQLSRVHSTFHVSNLKKCLPDVTLGIPLDEIQIDDKLYFFEEPMEIMDCEVKRLKQSRIHYVKVRWNSRRGPELTREREYRFQKKYPHLIANLHHCQMPQLELRDEAHLTGKGFHTP